VVAGLETVLPVAQAQQVKDSLDQDPMEQPVAMHVAVVVVALALLPVILMAETDILAHLVERQQPEQVAVVVDQTAQHHLVALVVVAVALETAQLVLLVALILVVVVVLVVIRRTVLVVLVALA
jgi:hypothetical protein